MSQLIAGDFSAIEARVLAWLSSCTGLLDAYRTGRSPYCDLGQIIMGAPTPKGTQGYQIGKAGVLGCGYGMGAEKFATTLRRQGIDVAEDVPQTVVDTYRSFYHEVPKYWKRLQVTALATVHHASQSWMPVDPAGLVCMAMHPKGWLMIRLPSGRCIWYAQPRISKREAPWIDQQTGKKAIVPCVTVLDPVTGGRSGLYGGLLAENVTQAVARDCLAEKMLGAEARGWPIVLTVHDELVAESDVVTLDMLLELLREPIRWAKGLPLDAEGWSGDRYRK